MNSNNSWSTLWREALVAISLGWDLAIPIFAGVLIGYALDRWLGTGHIFTLGLLVMGIFLGYYNIARFIQRINQKERFQADQEAIEKDGEQP